MKTSMLCRFRGYAIRALAVAALVAPGAAFSQAPAASAPAAAAHVVGIAYVGRTVSDLDKSVAFYEALGFKRDSSASSQWGTDEVTAREYGVPKGTQTRVARMVMNSSVSGKDFVVYLREFKGITQKHLAGYTPWEPGAPHFCLVVADAEATWAQLKASGLLRARSWGGELVALPGQTKKMIAYMTDPDGVDIEIIDRRLAPPAPPDRPRPVIRPGINHVGLVILDSDKARGFYHTLLGGTLVNAESPWLGGDSYDSVVGGHGNVLRFFNESFPEAADPAARLNFELVEYQNRKKPVASYSVFDIGTSYVAFEVNDLDAFLARAQAAGAKPVSNSGIVATRNGTRVVIIRDPDVGGFVELYDRPKK